MATNQISTSVTIISSLKGYQSVSLDSMDTTSVPTVLAGSVLEVAGAFFQWGTDETPNASSWTAIATASTVYMQCTPSGSAGSQILTTSYTDTAPIWSTSKQGWYSSAGSSIRAIATLTKGGATSYSEKRYLSPSGGLVFNQDVHVSSNLTVLGTASLATVNIDAGAIDNTSIGATTPTTGTFTTATATEFRGSLYDGTLSNGSTATIYSAINSIKTSRTMQLPVSVQRWGNAIFAASINRNTLESVQTAITCATPISSATDFGTTDAGTCLSMYWSAAGAGTYTNLIIKNRTGATSNVVVGALYVSDSWA